MTALTLAQMAFMLEAVGSQKLSVYQAFKVTFEIATLHGCALVLAARSSSKRDDSPWFLGLRSRLVLDNTGADRMIAQRTLQLPTGAVQPTHDGADGAIHDVGDLSIGEFLDVTE